MVVPDFKPTMSNLELPKLVGEIMLEVFTHKSIKAATASVTENDNGRLALLGQSVLEMVTTHVLFSQRPVQSAEEIRKNRESILADDNVRTWAQSNGMLKNLKYAPEVGAQVDNPEDIRFLVYSYIGALYIQNGTRAIQPWMSAIVDPNAGNEPLLPPSPPSHPAQPPTYSQLGSGSQYRPTPPQPTGPPPPLPSPPPPETMHMNDPSPVSPSPSSTITIALVNQIASQKGCQIQYTAESIGPAHQPTWTVRCKVNGQERGTGRGKNQRIAKEEAARQAYFVMGWGS